MGEFTIRTSYTQIDTVQKIQQSQHAELEAQKQQASGQVIRHSYEEGHTVGSSHKAESDRVHEKKGNDTPSGGRGDGRKKKKKDQPPGDGHHIDVQV